MNKRVITRLIPAMATSDGAGVRLRRSLGQTGVTRLDPFLMLDEFSSDNSEDYIAGFPDHPHRGFETVTYMLDGHMLHEDHMGNQGNLRAGDVQWMTAGRGIIHSEMPQQKAGRMRGFQLWINLPAGEKLSAPAYQEFSAEAFPVYREAGMQVKVLSGEYAGLRGPVEDPHTQVQYLDVTLAAGRRFEHELTGTLNAFVYVFEGTAEQAGTHLPRHTLAVPGKGETLTLEAGSDGARFILVAGRPIGEPIAQYGPFVMNTQEEIHQAMRDYRDGRLVQQRAEVRGE